MKEAMETIALVQVMVDSGLFVLIWLVQLIIYPSFQYTQDRDFVGWHRRYAAMISLFVVPLMFLQLGVEAAAYIGQDVRWLRILVLIIVWGATFALSVPCHSRLQNYGKNIAVIRRLVRTNWIRTLGWSILLAETVFMLAKE